MSDRRMYVVVAAALVVIVGFCTWRWNSRVRAPEPAIEGMVLTPSGEPAGGATVYVAFNTYEDPRTIIPPQPRVTTDAEGRFRITGLVLGRYFLVAGHSSYCDSEAVQVVLSRRGARGARLSLTRGGTIEGTIRSSKGHVAHREIRLSSWREQKTVTNENGGFRFTRVWPGLEYGIYVYPYPGDTHKPFKVVKVAEGETLEVLVETD